METKGNTLLITGATSGIGLAFAEAFHLMGNTVIICGRREDRLKAIAERFPGMITRACNVADAMQREELADWTLHNYPELNILMNNAGIQLSTNLVRPLRIERIMEEIGINLVAPIHLSSLLAPHLSGKKTAAIINISSGLAFAPIAFMAIYCASKAALHSITLSLRHQLRDKEVKVFEIIPSSTDTELGHERRTDKTQTHGGMPVNEFLTEAMKAIQNDLFEAAIGNAKNLRDKKELMFRALNP